MPAEILARRRLVEGWSTLSRLRLRMPDGAEVERHLEHHGDAVAVLPYDPVRGRVLLVTQPRAPVCEAGEADILEIAAGQLEGADAEACARREAMEELGLDLGRLELVAVCWSMPGVSTERLHLFLAPYGPEQQRGQGGGAPGEHENIRVVEMSIDEAWSAAARGAVPDMKTLLALHALRVRRADLFSA
ncbi:MAG TPA: NUDIX hydrolase [Caulobacteraceae bacterium]